MVISDSGKDVHGWISPHCLSAHLRPSVSSGMNTSPDVTLESLILVRAACRIRSQIEVGIYTQSLMFFSATFMCDKTILTIFFYSIGFKAQNSA